MYSSPLLVVCALVTVAWGHLDYGNMPIDYDMPQLFSRDAELMEAPPANGAKYMTGGGGEGSQRLHPEGDFEWREEVKTDNALPAYCQPPNPCPHGYTAEHDGCLEEFENTADFSKKWQESQNCVCDEEHMHGCPKEHGEQQRSAPAQESSPDNINMDDQMDAYLEQQNLQRHASVVAKKGAADANLAIEHYPRRKRSADQDEHKYDWMQGERIIRVAKKG